MLDLTKNSRFLCESPGFWSVSFFFFARDPGDQVFELFGGDEHFHFGLGMHQEWRHGMIEIQDNYGITQGDLKHCLHIVVNVTAWGAAM